MDDYIDDRKKAIELAENEEEEVYNHPEFVIKCLNSLIRYNKKIQTVNLNNCGLNG